MKISEQQILKMYLMFNDLLGYKHIREYVGLKKIEEMDYLMLEIINQQEERIIDTSRIEYNNYKIKDEHQLKAIKEFRKKLNNV